MDADTDAARRPGAAVEVGGAGAAAAVAAPVSDEDGGGDEARAKRPAVECSLCSDRPGEIDGDKLCEAAAGALADQASQRVCLACVLKHLRSCPLDAILRGHTCPLCDDARLREGVVSEVICFSRSEAAADSAA